MRIVLVGICAACTAGPAESTQEIESVEVYDASVSLRDVDSVSADGRRIDTLVSLMPPSYGTFTSNVVDEIVDAYRSDDAGRSWRRVGEVYRQQIDTFTPVIPFLPPVQAFQVGDDAWFAFRGGALRRSGDTWVAAPEVPGGAAYVGTHDGRAALLHSHGDGDIMQVTLLQPGSALTLSAESATRPIGVSGALPGWTEGVEVFHVGIDAFNPIDPLWEDVFHHVHVGEDGAVREVGAFGLKTAWTQSGGHVPRLEDIDVWWQDQELHLLLTLAEVGEGDEAQAPTGYGLMYAVWRDGNYSPAGIVARSHRSIRADVSYRLTEPKVVWKVEQSDDEAPDWAWASIEPGGLSGWHDSPGTDFYAAQARVFPEAIALTDDGAVAGMALGSDAVYGLRWTP